MKFKKRIGIHKDVMWSFIICFVIAFLSFLPFIIKGKGFFVLTNDFNDQQIPFTIGLHNALLDGGISGFSWDIDLGTSTIDGFSFYELGSPFFWLSMLFPANMFPYIVAWLFMLKFALAGATSSLYLRRFVFSKRWSVAGSILYAFSGFSLVNLVFYHFHDAIVFFPLLLIGMEEYKKHNRYIFFIFTIFLNCFINYFFFVGEVIFLIIYYLCRFASRDIKAMIIDVAKCIACGFLGVGMASILFIPNIIFIMGNPRTTDIASVFDMLKLTLPEYMYIVKNMLLPSETMTSVSAVYQQNFSSHGLYLPMIGMAPVVAFIIKKRDWLSKLIVICSVASFIPLFSDLFYIYSAAQMRWWYMYALMVILASIRMLEFPETKAIRQSTIIYIASIVIFVSVVYVLNRFEVGDRDWINNPVRFYAYAIIAVVGALITYYLTSSSIINYKAMLTGICVYSLGLMLATCYIYKTCDWMGYQAYKQRYDIAIQLELPSEQYRLNDTMNLISMTAHVAGFTNQTSTNTNSIFDFEDLFDYYANVVGMPKNEIPGLAELLGGKYYLAFEELPGMLVDEYETDLGKVYLMEREACPIGFAVDSYITTEELKKLEVDSRAIALLDSAVIDEADVTDEIKDILPENKAEDIDLEKSVSDYVTEHTYGSVLGFEKDGHGMSCITNYDEDTYVYFSVPYDTGWTATVDGQEIDIIVSGGMMLIKVPAGQHSVVFSYCTPGYKAGVMASVICWIIFIAINCYYASKKKSTVRERGKIIDIQNR